MTTTKVDFRSVGWKSVEWTNLFTLYLRAYESRSPQPILGDRAAADAVDRIDYDFKRIHRSSQPWAWAVMDFLSIPSCRRSRSARPVWGSSRAKHSR